MSTTTYDLARHAHTVTYTVDKHSDNQFLHTPDTVWVLRAECAECGWFHHQTITNRGGDPFTQYHRDLALQQHHLGIGMFAVPKTSGIGNDLFVREADRSYWRLTYNDGQWERSQL